MGRSRSNSRSRSRSSSGQRSRSHSRRRNSGRRRSRSNSGDEMGTRVHVSDIPVSLSKADLEKTFEKFGPLMEVWKTNSVPCFAFVVFRNKDDAEDAIRSLNGQ
jgi:splicing factor, arginine/serine-rich 7